MGARATEELLGVQLREVRRAFLGGLLVQRFVGPSEEGGTNGTELWLLPRESLEEVVKREAAQGSRF